MWAVEKPDWLMVQFVPLAKMQFVAAGVVKLWEGEAQKAPARLVALTV